MSILLDRKGQRLEDRYLELTAGQHVPADRTALVPLLRLHEIPEKAVVGLLLPNTVDVLTLPEKVLHLPLLALDFPAFADGRAYSQATSLIQRRGYKGQLRARGKAVVHDQLGMLRSCGFTEFQLRDDQNAEFCARMLSNQPCVNTLRSFPSNRELINPKVRPEVP
jgi:uncharacterized protein (DUF934 family)